MRIGVSLTLRAARVVLAGVLTRMVLQLLGRVDHAQQLLQLENGQIAVTDALLQRGQRHHGAGDQNIVAGAQGHAVLARLGDSVHQRVQRLIVQIDEAAGRRCVHR